MTTVTVFDPPMCCTSGVCGPEVDPELSRFAADLDWLRAQGVDVRRFNLAKEPALFAEQPAVKDLLERSGGDALPAIVVDDVLVAENRYPAREELASFAALEAAASVSEQVRELVAIGAAIGASCEPCFKFHYDKARKLGVSVAAMREAVRVGDAVKAASAKNIVGLADRMLGAPATDIAAAGGGGTAAEPASGGKCCG